MRIQISSLLAGLTVGVGLSVSGMTNTHRVLGFLDIAGQWDPTLMFVMGAGVVVAFIGYKLVLKNPAPLFEDVFSLPTRQDIDKALIVGAVLFGLGWGLVGYCPGPAIAGLTTGYIAPLLFVPAMIIGLLLARQAARFI